MPAVCAYPRDAGKPDLEEVAAYNRGPRPPPNWAHESRRHLVRLVPPVRGLWNCFTHSNCTCNDIISATNRVCGVTPVPTKRGVLALQKAMKKIRQLIPASHITPWSLDEVVASFKGKKQKRYSQAAASVKVNPLTWRDAWIKAFTKSEKFEPYVAHDPLTTGKVNPDPRMIQARSPRFNVVIAKYLRPIEHYIYRLKRRGLRVIAKGLNQVQRAILLHTKLSRFADPVVFSIDGSRWDKHCVEEVIKVEHSLYTSLCPEPEFQRMLDWQLNNKCTTNNGVKYFVKGGRMSGDMNTALGNCVLMCAMVTAAMSGVKNWDMLDDGDDCLVIVERESFEYVQQHLPKVFLEFGQEVKIENVADDIRDVTFCQSKVVVVEGVPKFVRPWRKVLSQSCCGVRHWGEPSEVRPMMGAVGMCELVLNRGVPILQEFAAALIRNARGELPRIMDVDDRLEMRVRAELGLFSLDELKEAATPLEVKHETRVEFQRTWGVPVQEQLEIERTLRAWEVRSTVAKNFPGEWDSRWESMVAPENELPLI